MLREVSVPPATLLVLYTDGVREHQRKPLQGAAELMEAALFATKFSALPAAAVTPPAPGPLRTLTKDAERPC